MGSRLCGRLAADAQGSQILEFALTVPLLVVFVVGIYDFGQAFNTKEKLNFAVKDGSRFAATQPTNDLSQGTPLSVTSIRDLIDADLISEGINDCGLGSSSLQQTGSVAWTATATCQYTSAPSTLTLTIDRGLVVPPVAGASTPVQQISTHIDIQYPYQWQFSSVIKLLIPGTNYAGTTLIQTDGVAANQD